jgi:hypothetical protein
MEMKRVTLWFALAICLASPAAWAGDEPFCQDATREFVDWIVQTKRLNRARGSIQRVQERVAENVQRHGYKGVINLMATRAGVLLDKHRSERELQAELFGLCMSQT